MWLVSLPLVCAVYRCCGLEHGSGVRLMRQNSLPQKTRPQVASSPEAQGMCEARQHPAEQKRKADELLKGITL
jgi:hypothetical protein